MLRVQEYVQRASDFLSLGVRVVFVGHGGEKKGRAYIEQLKMQDGQVPLYLDAKRVTHKALGLTDIGWMKLFSDSKGFKISNEASKKGFKVAVVGTGSFTQLGGVALLSKDKGIEVFHRCETTHDYPDIEDLLARCKPSDQ